MGAVSFETLSSAKAKSRIGELIDKGENVHVVVVEKPVQALSESESPRQKKLREGVEALERLERDAPVDDETWEEFFAYIDKKYNS